MNLSDLEAAALAFTLQDTLIRLEMFKDRADKAIPHLRSYVAAISEGGVDERDQFRVNLLNSVIAHLETLHKRSPLDAIFGKWPGDETDEQIKKALEELS